MPLANTRELKEDVLFRASEPLTQSAWDGKTIDYLNRVYRTMAAGASEFLPEFVDDWWWMRRQGTLVLDPIYNSGLIGLIKGDVTALLSEPPPFSITGWRLRLLNHPDVFIVEEHVPSSPTVLLDIPYTGETNALSQYQAMHVEYTLDAEAQVLISPMIGFRRPLRINGLPPEKMDELYPLADLRPGMPETFTVINENTVQFSHGGRDDGVSMRVEYRYRPVVDDLTDSVMSIPLVPAQWMHVLADMALVYVLLDKNDDRSNAVALGARTGLAAMLKESRRRNTKIDTSSAQVTPRPAGTGYGGGPRAGTI